MAWAVSANTDRFDEAVTWFRSRIPYTTAQFDALEDKARARAFHVAADIELEAVQTIFDEMATSIEHGTPLEEFQKRVSDKLNGKVGLSGYYTETVFRNWVQTAYNTGRWYQLTDPDLVLLRPFFLVDAVLDSRTSEICNHLDGTLKPADDPWWLTHWCPYHHRCRTSIRSLRRRDATRKGITEGEPTTQPQEGFGLAPPLRNDDALRPKQSRFDPRVWEAFQKRSQQVETELQAANENAKKRRKKRDQRDPQHWFTSEYKDAYGEHAGKAISWGRAMEHRGRALGLTEARAEHKKLVAVGAKGAPSSDDLFDRIEGLKLEGIADAKDVGTVLDILDAAGSQHARTAQELRVTSSLLGHARSIEVAGAPDFPKPRWSGTWSYTARERLVQGHERAADFLGVLTDKSVIAPKVKIVARHRRAGYSSGTIYVRGRELAGDMVHEWGHALEDFNAPIRDAAREFLARRTANETARKLRDLEPGKAYGPREVAKKDGFFAPYIGRIYSDGSTEVTSMGLDLIRQQRAVSLYYEDPEHFWLTLGLLAGTKIP